jgi:hypothetical protein
VIEGAREAAAAPLEIGKHAIPPLGVQLIQALFEKSFVIHPELEVVAVDGC